MTSLIRAGELRRRRLRKQEPESGGAGPGPAEDGDAIVSRTGNLGSLTLPNPSSPASPALPAAASAAKPAERPTSGRAAAMLRTVRELAPEVVPTARRAGDAAPGAVPGLAPARATASLGAMIAAAPERAVVRIPPGVYRERLTIVKPVVLMPRDGPGTVTVELAAICPVLADTEIRDLRFTGAGIGVGAAALLALTRCGITDVGTTGLSVRDRGRLRARGTRISGTAGNGLHMTAIADAVLEDCRIEKTAFSAVHLAGGSRLELELCDIHGSAEHGVRVTEHASLSISGCGVEGSGMSGISAETAGRLMLIESRVSGAERAGIVLGTGTRARIARCRIEEVAGSGVVVWSGATARMQGVAISGTGKNGLFIAEEAHGVFEDCEIHHTEFPALHIGERADPVLCGLRIHDVDQDADIAEGAQPTLRNLVAESVAVSVLPQEPAAAPDVSARSLDELIARFDELVGLGTVKQDANSLIRLIRLAQRRIQAGLPPPPTNRHLVFAGEPGTGQTAVAGLYGRILHSLGIIEHGHLVEADAGTLVDERAGHSARKTTAVFREALGGVLFIHRAGSLMPSGGGDDSGRECISTLVDLMEEHRDDVVVIAAGPLADMRRLIGADPGLSCRFTRTLTFGGLDARELAGIVGRQAAEHSYELGAGTEDAVLRFFEACDPEQHSDGGRTARRLFQTLAERHADRIAGLSNPSVEQLTTLLPEDVPEPTPSWPDAKSSDPAPPPPAERTR